MDARILVIEDDESIAAVMLQVLAEEGYSITSARSTHEAQQILTAADGRSWDLVISDATLGRKSERQPWLTELRRLTTAPIVIVSGWPAKAFAGYEEQGFAAVVQKPFDLDELLTVVAEQVRLSTVTGEDRKAAHETLVLTALPGGTYSTYVQAAEALESNTPALFRHVLSGMAPLLAQVPALAPGQPPDDIHISARLSRGDMFIHRGLQFPLSTGALRAHQHVTTTVDHARTLLERAGETYMLATAAVERSQVRRNARHGLSDSALGHGACT